MRLSAKIAPTFDYAVLERFWADADSLGYESVWNYDHFYGLQDLDMPTLEAWTTLTAMAFKAPRARIGCMVTGITYRHPALLANMGATVDHISGGRLEFGIGAAWHEPEHTGYGIPFPSPAERIAMLDEACTVIKRLWTEDRVDHEGRFFTLREARCNPKPVQARVPFTIGGVGEQLMLGVIARHADRWNAPSLQAPPEEFARLSGVLDERCASAGRDPSTLERSVQLFVFPEDEAQIASLDRTLDEYAQAGCEHVVLSFYSPPSRELLAKLAPR